MEIQTFGGRLRQLRIKTGLTQPELASGITSVSHISLIESNKRQPSDEIVLKLANRLKVSLELLREGPDSTSNQLRRKDYVFAEMSFKNGEAKYAQTLLENIIRNSAASMELEFDVNVRFLYAQTFEFLGDLESATREMKTAIAMAGEAGLPLRVIEMTIDLSRYAKEIGDFITALELIETAQKAVPFQLQKTATYARLLSSAIAIHYLRGDYIRANDLSQDAMEVFDDQTDPIARASIYWNASLAADAVQDSAQALLLAQRAAGLFSEEEDARAEGTLRNAIAWLLTRQTPPDVEGARAQLDRARVLLEEYGTTVDFTYYEIELARVEWLDGNYEKSLEISTSALEKVNTDGDRLQRAEAYLLISRAQISLGREAESAMNLLAAKSSLSEMEPSRQNALAWRELGDIYSGLGYLEDSIDAYREALQEAGVPASPLAFSEFEKAKQEIGFREFN
jgi:transcriptional regulator with XRE-family HTH domain